ncbi:MAG: hypothetical protein IMZ69_01920 [Spirochaetes bacterium]|nr:hypothetical protein [Spirochaetota bacterium]
MKRLTRGLSDAIRRWLRKSAAENTKRYGAAGLRLCCALMKDQAKRSRVVPMHG